MGSICKINRNPKRWVAYPSGKHTKPEYGDEDLVHIEYGVFHDEPGGQFNLTIYMRQSIYDKLMSGEYHVAPGNNLRICDKSGNPIPPINQAIY